LKERSIGELEIGADQYLPILVDRAGANRRLLVIPGFCPAIAGLAVFLLLAFAAFTKANGGLINRYLVAHPLKVGAYCYPEAE
jgi:hypothetical protein